MVEKIVEDVRKGFRVYPKHERVLEEYVESSGLVFRKPAPRERIRSKREQALRDLIASALEARGDKLLLGDRIVGKVDYYITRELPPPKQPMREGKYAEQEDQDDEQGIIAYNRASWHTLTPRHESNVPPGQGMVRLDGTGEEGRGLLDVLHDPVDPYSGVETAIAVEQIIARAKLAPRELEVIKLRYFRGLDRDEVAQYMGIKLKTVDELRLRGVRKLRAVL
jgi:RNA polymerase sigma factor (sigma-70 family)